MPLPPDTVPEPSTRHDMRMLGCALFGPLLVLAMLAVSYGWHAGYCRDVSKPGALSSLGIATLVAALAAWRCRRELARLGDTRGSDPAHGRARFVAITGLALNGYAVLMLGGLSLPILLLRPCE